MAGLYRRVGQSDADCTEIFEATSDTSSPWSPDLQHGGPVSALLARAMDRCQPRPSTRLARVSVDILGAVPLGPVRVSARIERPGRRVELLSSCLKQQAADGRWRPAARATAWRLATRDTTTLRSDAVRRLELPSAETTRQCRAHPLPQALHASAFVHTLEWRYDEPTRAEGSPTVAWMRMTRPLVEGEDPTPLEQAVAIADVANGTGARLDPDDFAFPNTELTVHLHQQPAGEWFGLAAETSIGDDGVGLSAATMHHEAGPLGRVAQILLVEPQAG